MCQEDSARRLITSREFILSISQRLQYSLKQLKGS